MLDLVARFDTFMEHHDKSIVASFTILLALSTIGLWWSTRKLWKATRDEFLSTHRPKLIVRQFILQPPVVNDLLKVDFSILNIGNTEAKVRGIAAEVALWNGKFWQPPGIDRNVRPFGPKVVRNGESHLGDDHVAVQSHRDSIDRHSARDLHNLRGWRVYVHRCLGDRTPHWLS